MADARTARWRRITLATLFTGYAGYYLCRSNLSVVTPLLLEEYAAEGLTKETIGAISSLGVFLYALGKVTNGVLTDFVGGRLLFLLGMAISILCTVLIGLTSGMIVFAVLWAINRYVQSMGWGSLVKIASRWFPFTVHATIMGILSMSYLLGDALVRVYLGLFIQFELGWRGVFFVAAGTLGAIAVLAWRLLKDSPRDIGAEEPLAGADNVFGAGGEQPHPESLARLLGPLLGNPVFWLVCLMNFGLTLIRESFNFWTPTYLTEAALLDPGTAAQYSMAFPFVGAVSALLGGALSDRLGGKHGRVALPCLVLLCAALGLLCIAPTNGSVWLPLLLICLVSFFLIAPYSFCSGVIPLDLGSKQGGSTAAGLIDAVGYLGAVLSGYGIGALVQQFGWPTAFAALAAAAGLTALATALYWWRQEFTRHGGAASLSPPEHAMNDALLSGGAAVIERIFTLFRARGDAAYIGEPVSQTEHALQAAWAAEKAQAGSALVVAALLHDIGHLLHHLPEDCAQAGIDDRHESLGARWVERHFGPAVSEAIRLHVPAKRYLCATEPGYRDTLSEASVLSLQLQGGPFSPAESSAFEQSPHLAGAVALRRWDDAAKIPGLTTPDLEHFRPHLEAVVLRTPVA